MVVKQDITQTILVVEGEADLVLGGAGKDRDTQGGWKWVWQGGQGDPGPSEGYHSLEGSGG